LEGLVQLLPLILVFLLIYLLMIRPAARRNRDLAALQRALSVGDRVMLTSGIYGTVHSLADDELQVELAAGVVVTVARGAVAKVVEPTVVDDDPTDEAGAPEPGQES
jgi:preprotein translocase subunit YajC